MTLHAHPTNTQPPSPQAGGFVFSHATRAATPSAWLRRATPGRSQQAGHPPESRCLATSGRRPFNTKGPAVAFTHTKGRGPKYGRAHINERRARAAQHQPHHPCTRCHKPLGPMSPRLHLDHAEDGTYLGFAHARCNMSAGARKGAAIVNAQRGFKRPVW